MKKLQGLKRNAFIISLCAVILIILAVSVHSYSLTKDPDPQAGVSYTYYNNYIIFSQSFHHLLGQQDLYQHYPGEYYDLYKYSPTFSLLMAPFAVLPDWAGLILWNLLNALVLFFAIWKVKDMSQGARILAVAFLLIELITSVQNAQSNALMAGLIILSFTFMEKDKPWTASLLLVLTIFIKLYGIVALAFFIFYPRKIKTSLITLLWILVMAILPLIVITPAELIQQYRSWISLLGEDHTVYYGMSVMGWLHSWFGCEISKNIIVLIGAVALLLPLLKLSRWPDYHFRMLFLASLLVWMVIFNHMAESPTYVIAVSGVALWFFGKEKRNWLDITLLSMVFIFTVLSPTDIFPSTLRKNFVEPYVLKAVPCIFVWFKIQFDLYMKDTHSKFGPST